MNQCEYIAFSYHANLLVGEYSRIETQYWTPREVDGPQELVDVVYETLFTLKEQIEKEHRLDEKTRIAFDHVMTVLVEDEKKQQAEKKSK